MPLLMKTLVANCSDMDATATSLIVLISIKLYNLPPTKTVTNVNIKTVHYQIVNYLNDGCIPAIKPQILWLGIEWIHALIYHNYSRYKISIRRNLRNGPV